MKQKLSSLLKWSEQYTRTDMHYLVGSGFWMTINYVVQVSIGIISTIALANLLPKESLGMYQFILASAGIIGAFTLTGIGTAISRAVAQGHDGVLRSGVRTRLKWSVGVVVASLILAGYYGYMGNTDLTITFVIVGICTAITDSFILYESYLIGKKAFKHTVTLGLWRKPIPLIALLSTLYFTTHIPILIGVYLGTTMLSTLLVYAAVVKKYQPPYEDHPETIAYSKQLSIMNIFSLATSHADKVLLWYLLGPVAVASFSIAQLAMRYTGGLASNLSYIALPKVAERDLLTLQATLPRKINLFVLAMIPFVLVYMLAVPFIFSLLFPQYPESIPLAQVLGLLLLFIPGGVYTKVLTAHRQTRALYLLSTLIPALKLIIMAGLIPLFGIWGAVYALIAGYAVTVLYTWYLFTVARPIVSEDAIQ